MTALVINSIIGSGIFGLPSELTQDPAKLAPQLYVLSHLTTLRRRLIMAAFFRWKVRSHLESPK
jgi:hypothetical protein